MSRVQFFREIFKKAFHGAFKFAEICEVSLMLALHPLSKYVEFIEHYEGLLLFSILIISLVIFLIKVLWIAYQMYHDAESERVRLTAAPPNLVAERDQLQRDLANVCASINTVMNEGVKSQGKHEITKFEQTIFIENDWSFRGTKEVDFKALEPIRLFASEHDGDHPISTLADLSITVQGDGNHQVVWLPAGQAPCAKRFMLVFVPQVQTDTCSKYEVSWKWPKMWENLSKNGVDRWVQYLRSESMIPIVRFNFRIHRDLHALANVRFSSVGDGGGMLLPMGDRLSTDGYKHYTWEMTNINKAARVEILLESA